jgi:hypothetical protein
MINNHNYNRTNNNNKPCSIYKIININPLNIKLIKSLKTIIIKKQLQITNNNSKDYLNNNVKIISS